MSKVIVSLDLESKEKIDRIVEMLDFIEYFKVGPIPYLVYGNELIEKLKKRGKKIFLDLKFFDIPNTVKKSVKCACLKGVDMLTLHIMGGEEMVKSAIEGKNEVGAETKILGITVLTSLKEKDIDFATSSIREMVFKLAERGYNWGIDGIVCSGEELPFLRKKFPSPFLMVVPGIRMEERKDDQKRVITPSMAVKKGADFIVVGRPVYESENPVKSVERIIKEVKIGEESMGGD
ncbi:orotidine-5'-phosphate decarboxylase [bacterium]|nr:orotidine-5'-phosphate decarboxylase [bacterium]